MRVDAAAVGRLDRLRVATLVVALAFTAHVFSQDARSSRDGVELRELRDDGGLTLVAQNSLHGPVQAGLYLGDAARFVPPDTPLLRVLPARSETELLRLDATVVRDIDALEYELRFIPGAPYARHAPEQPYRLPYAVASRHPVTQAHPERITHTDLSSAHAVDFAMPVGTGVFAARAGTVMQVAADYFGSSNAGARRANLIRILHDDGTMAVYGHLHWDSIRVVAGQRVARGERIADSGNTGFSTGPHLHFDVQRNGGGAVVSIPVQFAGLGGMPVTVRSGDEPVAY